MEKKEFVREKLRETGSSTRRITDGKSGKTNKPDVYWNPGGPIVLDGDVLITGQVLDQTKDLSPNNTFMIRKEALILGMDAIERGITTKLDETVFSYENYLRTGSFKP